MKIVVFIYVSSINMKKLHKSSSRILSKYSSEIEDASDEKSFCKVKDHFLSDQSWRIFALLVKIISPMLVGIVGIEIAVAHVMIVL